LSCHVAAGRPWFGRRVSQGATLYLACERGALVKRRFAAWRLHHDIDDLPLAVVADSIDLRSSPADADAIIACAAEIADRTGQAVRLIVIDTASRALAGGDENGPIDMGRFVANLAKVQHETGAHIMVLHHVPVDGNRMRGHTALLAACDTTIRIEKIGTVRAASIEKTNDGADGEQVAFTIESVDLGHHPETGETTTAPICIPAAGDVPQPAKRQKITKAARLTLSALTEALNSSGQLSKQESGRMPAGVRTVSLSEWRQTAYRMGISASPEERAKQQAFKRGSEYLIGDGTVAVWDDRVWITRSHG
jgi:hypothetical protein